VGRRVGHEDRGGENGVQCVQRGKRFDRVLARRASSGDEFAYTTAADSRYKLRAMTDSARRPLGVAC
jgi:hypothetical protein